MAKREISNLELKLKVTQEYLDNGGYEKIWDIGLLKDLKKVKSGPDGKVDPDTISPRVNAFMLALLAEKMTPPFYSPHHISEYHSMVQKATSFDQVQVDTVEHFDKIYQEFTVKSDYLFRGQKEAKWRLYSTLQRHWILSNLESKFQSYQSLLEALVEKGRSKYRDEYISLLGEMHDDADNDVAVLSFLQHHGCPTPLLDWTYRFQNAVYFAIDGVDTTSSAKEIENYVSVYYIQEKDFEKGGMRTLLYESVEETQEFALNLLIEQFTEDEDSRKKMKEHFKGRKAIDTGRLKGSGMIAHMLKIKHMVNFPATYFADRGPDDIIFSLNNSVNIKNQAGVFTWNADPTKPFEMVVSEQNDLAKKETNDYVRSIQNILCECININKSLVPHIKQVLEADGIKKEFIYHTPALSTWHLFEECVKRSQV